MLQEISIFEKQEVYDKNYIEPFFSQVFYSSSSIFLFFLVPLFIFIFFLKLDL